MANRAKIQTRQANEPYNFVVKNVSLIERSKIDCFPKGLALILLTIRLLITFKHRKRRKKATIQK